MWQDDSDFSGAAFQLGNPTPTKTYTNECISEMLPCTADSLLSHFSESSAIHCLFKLLCRSTMSPTALLPLNVKSSKVDCQQPHR
jgi:hypothetical protein